MRIKLLFLLVGLFTAIHGVIAQEKESASGNHLIELKCEIRDKTTKKLLNNATVQMYSFPDTVEVGHYNVVFHSEEGYSDKKYLQKGKYLARIFTLDIEFAWDNEEESEVKTGTANMTESDEYEPQWIEVEITEADVDAKVKKMEPVYLDKKRKFSVPKPAEVKRSKS